MKISDFVIGLGFDTSDFERGQRRITSDLNNFRSDVLQIGAVLGTAFSAKSLTIDFARQNDQLRQMAELLGINENALYGLDEAGKAFGARSGEITSLLQTLTETKARFTELGELGVLEELAKIGVNIDAITDAKDSVTALYALADELSKLDQKDRLLVSNALGISPQGIDLLSNGAKTVRDLSKAYQDARPHTEEMTNASRRFIEEYNKLEQNLGGRADKISTPVVKSIGKIIEVINEFIETNQKAIDSSFLDPLGKTLAVVTPLAVGFVGSGILKTFAGLAKFVPVVGGALGVVLGTMSKLVPVVSALGIGFSVWDWDADDFEEFFGFKPPEWLFTPINELPTSKILGQVDPYNEGYQNIDVSSYLNTGAKFNQNSISNGRQNVNVQSTANVKLTLDGNVIAERVVKTVNDYVSSETISNYSTEDK